MLMMPAYLMIMIVTTGNGLPDVIKTYHEMPSWERCNSVMREMKTDRYSTDPNTKVIVACVGEKD
jgi:hypothetical protein